MRTRHRRSLLTGLGIALAAAMLVAALVVSDSLGFGFDRAARASDLPDIIVRFDPQNTGRVAQRIAALPDVAAYTVRTEVTGVGLETADEFAGNGAVEVVGWVARRFGRILNGAARRAGRRLRMGDEVERTAAESLACIAAATAGAAPAGVSAGARFGGRLAPELRAADTPLAMPVSFADWSIQTPAPGGAGGAGVRTAGPQGPGSRSAPTTAAAPARQRDDGMLVRTQAAAAGDVGAPNRRRAERQLHPPAGSPTSRT